MHNALGKMHIFLGNHERRKILRLYMSLLVVVVFFNSTPMIIIFRKIGKEVVFQQEREAHEGLRVNPVALKKVVNSVAVAQQLLSQPSNTDAVAVNVSFYQLSYVHCVIHAKHCVS